MRDLIETWLRLPSPDLATLRQHGIPYRATQIVGGVRQARDGRLLLPCWIDPPSIYHAVDDPVLLGVVAFNPGAPDDWTLHPEDAGAVMLGGGALHEAQYYGEPLPVFENPLRWVQAGGGGIFVLDWTVCLPLRFVSVKRFDCTSERVAARLHDAYEIRDRPEIYFEESLNAA